MTTSPDYRAPRAARNKRDIPNATTHRDCTVCRRTLPIGEFYPKFAGDPFGRGQAAVKRLCKAATKGGRPEPSEAAKAAIHANALKLPVPRNRTRRVSGRCRQCDKARGLRRSRVAQLKAAGHEVVTNALDTTAVVSPALSPGALEATARTGLIVVDAAGAPVLPACPTEALRVCYAALTSIVPTVPTIPKTANTPGKPQVLAHPARPGALHPERVALLQAIPALAADDSVPPKLAARAQDVIDCALVRDCGHHASEAMERLLERTLPGLSRRVRGRQRVNTQSHLLTQEEAAACLDEGVFLASGKWDALHASLAMFATVANMWALRASQPRTRAEHWVGSQKDSEGKWGPGATALVREGKSGDAYEVHAGTCTYGTQPLGVDAESRETERKSEAIRDVRRVMRSLSKRERHVVEGLMLRRQSLARVARDLGMTSAEVKGVVADCLGFLRTQLHAHEEIL